MAKTKRTTLSWKDIRSVLTEASREDLVSLVGDLYALRIENQDFLHARFVMDGVKYCAIYEVFPTRRNLHAIYADIRAWVLKEVRCWTPC